MSKDLRKRLAGLRKGIDRADDGVVKLLAQRRRLVLALAKVKRPLGVPIHDVQREAALLRRVAALAKRGGLDAALVRRLFRLIIADSKKAQRREAR